MLLITILFEIVRLRDSASHDKHQHQKLLKEAETHKADVAELSKMKERLEKRCEELEAVITDLQEMVCYKTLRVLN